VRKSKLFDAKNQRRGELIHKKVYIGLSKEEAAELEELQKWVTDYVDKRHPIGTEVAE